MSNMKQNNKLNGDILSVYHGVSRAILECKKGRDRQ